MHKIQGRDTDIRDKKNTTEMGQLYEEIFHDETEQGIPSQFFKNV